MWIARDSNGTLVLHLQKPIRNYFCNDWEADDFLEIDANLFPELTWNSEPLEVELVEKEAIK